MNRNRCSAFLFLCIALSLEGTTNHIDLSVLLHFLLLLKIYLGLLETIVVAVFDVSFNVFFVFFR